MQKNETGSLSYIIGKNKLKKDLNTRPKTIKLLGENIGSKLFDITLSNIFLDVSPQTRKTKKNKQMALHQTEEVLHSRGNH